MSEETSPTEHINEPNQGAELPGEGTAPASPRRNQFIKVDEPKNKQFTGRATDKESDRILAAINARKQPGQTYDIVRFCLDMMDNIEDDFLQTFKTK